MRLYCLDILNPSFFALWSGQGLMGDFNTLSPLLLRNHDVRAALNLSLQSLCLIKEVTPQKRFFVFLLRTPHRLGVMLKVTTDWVKNSQLLTIYFIVLTLTSAQETHYTFYENVQII